MSGTSVLCKYTTYNKPIIHLHAHRVSVQCGKTVEEVEAKKVYFQEIFTCYLKLVNHCKQVENRKILILSLSDKKNLKRLKNLLRNLLRHL